MCCVVGFVDQRLQEQFRLYTGRLLGDVSSCYQCDHDTAAITESFISFPCPHKVP